MIELRKDGAIRNDFFNAADRCIAPLTFQSIIYRKIINYN